MTRRLGLTKIRLLGALVIAVVGCGGSDGARGGNGGNFAGSSGNFAGSSGGVAGSSGGVAGSSGGVAGSSGGAGGGPLSFSQYQSLVLAAGCKNLVLCGDYPDVATCLSSDQVVPHLYDTLGADIADGKISYDPVQAQACVDHWNNLPCTRTATAKSASDPCDRVFTGTVAVGDPCFFDQECANGGSCLIDYTACDSSQCCPGSCMAAPTPVGVGDDCTSSTVVCPPGAICMSDTIGVAETCQMTVGLGGSCAGAALNLCAYPLYCDPNSQTCKAPVETGGTCNPQLASEDCDEVADQCEFTTSVCTRLPPAGSPCDPNNGGCLAYATCDAKTGTCVARSAVGQSCNGSVGCLDGNACDQTSSTCVLTPTAGACP